MAIINFKDKDQMVADMISLAVANNSPVTDFNRGSAMRTLFESVAWIISGFQGQLRVDWQQALQDFIYVAFSFSRKGGTKSNVELVFSVDTAPSSDITIPTGTLASTEDNITFETIESGVIPNGSTSSGSITARAIQNGSAFNVSANKITIMVTNLLGVQSVNNPLNATGGTDSENDRELRERFNLFISNLTRSTVGGLKSGALSVDGVKYVDIKEDLGTKATVEVIFTSNASETNAIVIPSGSRVSTASGVTFVTTEVGNIASGNGARTSARVTCEALNFGAIEVISIGGINTIIDGTVGVASVSNPIVSTTGEDGNLGVIDMLLDDGTGTISNSVLQNVIRVIEGDPDNVEAFPGYRASGIVINYGTPTIINVDITQTLKLSNISDRTSIITEVEREQTTYINSLQNGETVVRNKLIELATAVNGVEDIELTSPAVNVTTSSGQIAKRRNITTSTVAFV